MSNRKNDKERGPKRGASKHLPPLKAYVAVRHVNKWSEPPNKLAPAAYAFIIPGSDTENKLHWGRGGVKTPEEMYAHAIIRIVAEGFLDLDKNTLEIVTEGPGFTLTLDGFAWDWLVKEAKKERITAQNPKLWMEAAKFWYMANGSARKENKGDEEEHLTAVKESTALQAQTAFEKKDFNKQEIIVTDETDAAP